MSSKKDFSLFQSFHVRLTMAMVGSMLFVFILGFFLIFQYTIDSQFQAIRSRLMVIANTASLLVDPKLFDQVPLIPDGVDSPAYQEIVTQLKKIKDVNSKIAYIYTMKKTAKPGILQFVVDPNAVVKKGEKVLMSYPGNEYDARRCPEMLNAFAGPAADQDFTVDDWGTILSGYAPIVNDQGMTVGILGVDMMADDVYFLQKEIYRRGALVLGLGILLSLLIGIVLAERITCPLEKLTNGARSLAEDRLDHRVAVEGKDEISELATAFNVMAQHLELSRERLLNYFYDVVKSLVKALEFRDEYTRGHSEAVAEDAAKIALKMGYSEEIVQMLKKMTLLHDIGKIGIADTILNKKGPLTTSEWDDVKKHPIKGEEILRPVLLNKEMMAMIRNHHERYDGKGYPDQLVEKEISMFAAIVTVADAYDAMISKRAYKEAMTAEQAVEELKRNSGSQFHPDIVKIFIEVLEAEGRLNKGNGHLY